MSHPSISTERLMLTPYEMGDVDELHRVMSNPEVMRHIGKARFPGRRFTTSSPA